MRNRAKCKLCESVIESILENDYVMCKCGEISVSGGTENYRCSARDFINFLRVDDEGNIVVVKVQDVKKPNKKELLDMLDEMVKKIEDLPPQAMHVSITHYDFYSALLLVSSILRSTD
jgi:hypothetical protein